MSQHCVWSLLTLSSCCVTDINVLPCTTNWKLLVKWVISSCYHYSISPAVLATWLLKPPGDITCQDQIVVTHKVYMYICTAIVSSMWLCNTDVLSTTVLSVHFHIKVTDLSWQTWTYHVSLALLNCETKKTKKQKNRHLGVNLGTCFCKPFQCVITRLDFDLSLVI